MANDSQPESFDLDDAAQPETGINFANVVDDTLLVSSVDQLKLADSEGGGDLEIPPLYASHSDQGQSTHAAAEVDHRGGENEDGRPRQKTIEERRREQAELREKRYREAKQRVEANRVGARFGVQAGDIREGAEDAAEILKDGELDGNDLKELGGIVLDGVMSTRKGRQEVNKQRGKIGGGQWGSILEDAVFGNRRNRNKNKN